MPQIETLPDRLGQLLAWMSEGWQIEEPILQQRVLHSRSGQVCAYEVVVQRDGERRVIALYDEQMVQRWLEQNGITVLVL